MSPAGSRRLTDTFVVLVALHSYAVGIGLLLLPRFALPMGGFTLPADLFFVHQGGVFHLVVATGYLVDWFRHRSLALMLLAKGFASVFLASSWLIAADPPWLVGASFLQDAAMGAGALWLVTRRPRTNTTRGLQP
jgi:hypothetical protein